MAKHIVKSKPRGRSTDLTKWLAHKLKAMIARGALKPGARLPSERQLAADFAVNRGTLRPALKTLVATGFLVQRVGDGTYVSRDAVGTPVATTWFGGVIKDLTLIELFETRRIVEPELAARAALRRTDSDLVNLDSAVRMIAAGIHTRSLKTALTAERRFSRVVWQAAGDRVISRMLEPIHTTIAQTIEKSCSVEDYACSVSQHANILAAVRSGDQQAAGRAVSLHLDVTASILSRVSRIHVASELETAGAA